MSTDLTGCKIDIEQELPSHLYVDRFYELSIYLKCAGVPKFLHQENEVQVITSIISEGTKQQLHSPHFIFENPSCFKRSGDTSTRFKITSLSTQFQQYRIQCKIANYSPVLHWISEPFTVVQYKFGMTKQLRLIDGDKWYKDEGGKTNFLSFEIGLHENYDNIDRFVQLERDISFKLQLVYFDDKSLVSNQNILRVANEQQYVLSSTQNGKILIRFKIEQVSSHHQRRRFSLKVTPINDKTIGPSFTKPILVLSKRNRPKKAQMSAQKRKEVATKKKIKKRKRSLDVKEEKVHKKRKLNIKQCANDEDETEEEEEESFCSKTIIDDEAENKCDMKPEQETYTIDSIKRDNSASVDLNESILKKCAIDSEQYPSLKEYQNDPNKYFNYTFCAQDQEKKMKRNLVKCLRLCCDTFSVLSARPQYHPLYGFGEENTANVIYYCSFCKRFAANTANAINHYERCRILEVIQLLEGKQVIDSAVNSLSAIPIDKGAECKYDPVQTTKREQKTNININSNLDTNAMIHAMLRNIPSSALPMNTITNTNNDTIPTNNFAAALNEILQNATANNRHRNGNGNKSNMDNIPLPNPFTKLLNINHNK